MSTLNENLTNIPNLDLAAYFANVTKLEEKSKEKKKKDTNGGHNNNNNNDAEGDCQLPCDHVSFIPILPPPPSSSSLSIAESDTNVYDANTTTAKTQEQEQGYNRIEDEIANRQNEKKDPVNNNNNNNDPVITNGYEKEKEKEKEEEEEEEEEEIKKEEEREVEVLFSDSHSESSDIDIEQYIEAEQIGFHPQEHGQKKDIKPLLSESPKLVSCLSGPNNPKTILRKQQLQQQQSQAQQNESDAVVTPHSNSRRASVTFNEDVTVHTVPIWNPCGDTWYKDQHGQGIIRAAGRCCLIQ